MGVCWLTLGTNVRVLIGIILLEVEINRNNELVRIQIEQTRSYTYVAWQREVATLSRQTTKKKNWVETPPISGRHKKALRVVSLSRVLVSRAILLVRSLRVV
jgi:hypothetical protein